MRLVAGQKYVRGPAGEIMPYTSGVEKIKGCVVFTQKVDEADSLQLPENENMPKFRGRRLVETKLVKAPIETVVEAKELKPVRPKPVAAKQKEVFEHMDIRQEMEFDLSESGPPELE